MGHFISWDGCSITNTVNTTTLKKTNPCKLCLHYFSNMVCQPEGNLLMNKELLLVSLQIAGLTWKWFGRGEFGVTAWCVHTADLNEASHEHDEGNAH